MANAVVGVGSGKTTARWSGDLRRQRGDDGARDGVAKTRVQSAWTGVARVGVGRWPETYRAPAKFRVDGGVDLLREKGKEGHR